jgi:hypothetical protein
MLFNKIISVCTENHLKPIKMQLIKTVGTCSYHLDLKGLYYSPIYAYFFQVLSSFHVFWL